MADSTMKAKVTIRGTRPMLWHRFGPEALPLEKKERNGVAGNDPTEWERTHLATTDGQLYVEPTYVFACARDGAKYTKKGRGSLMPLVAATLQVEEDTILVDRFMPKEITTDPTQDVYLDIRGVKNPGSSGDGKTRDLEIRRHHLDQYSWSNFELRHHVPRLQLRPQPALCGDRQQRGLEIRRHHLDRHRWRDLKLRHPLPRLRLRPQPSIRGL